MQSPTFLSSFPLLSPQNPPTWKVNWLKACCFDDCHEILLVLMWEMWEGWLPPLTPLQTNCMCVWQCVCKFGWKKNVVNSSCCVLPATDICCCCYVMRLRLSWRIGCKWPIYLFLNRDSLLNYHFWKTWKVVKGDQGSQLDLALTWSNSLVLQVILVDKKFDKIGFCLIKWHAFLDYKS